MAGSQFGFNNIEVKPLDAAVSSPFDIVSLSSKPGSPKHTDVSIQPLET